MSSLFVRSSLAEGDSLISSVVECLSELSRDVFYAKLRNIEVNPLVLSLELEYSVFRFPAVECEHVHHCEPGHFPLEITFKDQRLVIQMGLKLGSDFAHPVARGSAYDLVPLGHSNTNSIELLCRVGVSRDSILARAFPR